MACSMANVHVLHIEKLITNVEFDSVYNNTEYIYIISGQASMN